MINQIQKDWDLEEKVIDSEKECTRTPNHANPIKVRLGDYKIQTKDVEESFSSYYSLYGTLFVSKIGKKPVMKRKSLFRPKVPVEEEFIEWEVYVPIRTYDDHSLYDIKYLANSLYESLKGDKILVNIEKTEELLAEALKPYVNRALCFCVDKKVYKSKGSIYEKPEKSEKVISANEAYNKA